MHLSRLAEELVIWTSRVRLFVAARRLLHRLLDHAAEAQPDAAELVRGNSGRILGALTSLFVTMKGLPLAYSKDMQEDKEPVFAAFDVLEVSLAAMAGMIETLDLNRERMAAAGRRLLHRHRPRRLGGSPEDLPFREAHHITGRAVRMADEARVRPGPCPMTRSAASTSASAGRLRCFARCLG